MDEDRLASQEERRQGNSPWTPLEFCSKCNGRRVIGFELASNDKRDLPVTLLHCADCGSLTKPVYDAAGMLDGVRQWVPDVAKKHLFTGGSTVERFLLARIAEENGILNKVCLSAAQLLLFIGGIVAFSIAFGVASWLLSGTYMSAIEAAWSLIRRLFS